MNKTTFCSSRTIKKGEHSGSVTVLPNQQLNSVTNVLPIYSSYIIGKSARYCMGMYFRLKDQVFCGSKPYSTEKLEAILKDEFGADTRMDASTNPK